jgi:hypothetical protein
MLEIDVPASELYIEDEARFVECPAVRLRLEHSLLSISKWESKWRKPFLDSKVQKTRDESIDYVRCMTLNQNVNPLCYKGITGEMLEKVNAYVNADLTATTFSSVPDHSPNRQVVTSELIYYWMAGYGIPIECQKWHLSRLLTLIRIFDIKSGRQKKMSASEIMAQNRSLNEARRKAAKSRG